MRAARQTPTEAEKVRNRVAERTRAGLTTATVERLIQAGQDGHEHTQSNVQRITDAPLDRLYRQGFISTAEFDAGDAYRELAYLAAIDPSSGSVNWNQAGGGGRSAKVPSMFTSQHIADARLRLRALDKQLSGVIATVARLALVKEMALTDIGRAVFGYRDRALAECAGRVATRMVCGALVDLMRA